MNDESRQAFKEEKRRIASQKKASQATNTNQLSTDRPFVSTDRSFVSTDRSNTPNVSAASTSTGANADESSFVYLGGKIPIDESTIPNADLPIDPNMPDLEDAYDTLLNDGIFNGAYDDEDVGAVADFNNMDNTIAVSPIPTLRIHKDHPKRQILGDPTSVVQTRGKIQKASSAQQALESYIHKQNRTNHKDHQNYLFACFLSQEEPKTISQALKDKVGLTNARGIASFNYRRNKRDERSIVVKNKARLVAQGFRQERSHFFMHYERRSVCSIKPPGFVDPAIQNKVYKVIKALYGLHQAPRAWDSPFELEAYSNSDYGGASLDRKSTTCGCQFLRRRLISWQCKKQTIVANSTTEAEYIAAANYCGQKPNESVGFTEVVDFLKGTSLRTLANGTQQLVASINSKEYIITEASVKSKLQLADATGIHNLSDAEIYAVVTTLEEYVPCSLLKLAGAAVDQGEGSAQPAEPHHTPVDPISSTSQPPIQSPPHPSPLPHSPPHSPPQSPL
ncbi:hypothetical protein Tco_0928399 [Tanacetum coccineum]